MKLSITSISKYDIASGILTISGYLIAKWTDQLLHWDETQFDAVTRISVESDEIWVPSLKQAAVAKIADSYFVSSVWLDKNGTASMVLAGEFIGYCEVDTLYYPADKQTCMFTVLATSNDASELSLDLIKDSVETNLFTKHGEWSINDSTANAISFFDRDIGLQLVGCMFRLNLTRRPLSILIYTCLPLAFIAILNMVIYVVPVSSGERVSFSVQILLTLIFFITSINDGIPRHALQIPLLSRAMAVLIFMCSVNVIISVILSRVATESIKPVTGCLKSFTRLFLNIKLGRQYRKKRVNVAAGKETICATNESGSPDPEKPTAPAQFRKIDITWIMVVDMFDYIIFYVHIIVVIAGIVSAGMFISDVW